MKRYKRMSKAEFLDFMDREWGYARPVSGRISQCCPIARYLQTKFPDKEVAVGYDLFTVEDADGYYYKEYSLPNWAQKVTRATTTMLGDIHREHVKELVNG